MMYINRIALIFFVRHLLIRAIISNCLRLTYNVHQFVQFPTKEDKRVGSRLARLYYSFLTRGRVVGIGADKLTGLIISDHRITCSGEYGLPLGDFPPTAHYFQSLAFVLFATRNF